MLKLRMSAVLSVAGASAAIYGAYAIFLLDDWWNLVKLSAVAPEDRSWVARHDGGMIVAGLTEIIFTGFLLALNLAVAGTVKSIFKINRVEPPAPAASIRHATPDDLPATPPTFS